MNHLIVPDIVHGQTLTLMEEGASVREAARIMAERRIGAVMIVRGERLEGILTERDVLVRVVAPSRDPDTTQIGEVMTRNPDTVAPDSRAIDALLRMREKGYRHLPVVDKDRVVGMVSIRDLYDAVKQELEEDLQEREAFIFGSGYATAP
ncbi:MAG: CBS domain-containing protein [Proteobacteria bacterium]|nr:CBS domain-containing protein [Pseudomonadota bacterium]MBI3496835.1 CBS domain-containing protein [Pseudomonadota bacterium]